jgi:hypothetical protein
MKHILALLLLVITITSQAQDVNLNVLLFDSAKAADKDLTDPNRQHVHLFNRHYLTNGSEALIDSNLQFGLTEIQKREPIDSGAASFSRDEELPWSYCINDGVQMTGFFLDYYVSGKLGKNTVDLVAFKAWFETVVVNWMNLKDLGPKVLSDKPGEYWKKIIGKVI